MLVTYGLEGGSPTRIMQTMTIPWYKELKEAWRLVPPPGLLMTWRWGYKAKSKEERMSSKDLLKAMKQAGLTSVAR